MPTWKRSKKNQSLIKQRKRKRALELLEGDLKRGTSRSKITVQDADLPPYPALLTEYDRKRITKEISNLKAKL